MRKNNKTCLCLELQTILDEELKIGNILLLEPCVTDWPCEGSVFASLKNPLTVMDDFITENIKYSLNEDLHFGWVNSCECKIHHDLLVSGELMSTK